MTLTVKMYLHDEGYAKILQCDSVEVVTASRDESLVEGETVKLEIKKGDKQVFLRDTDCDADTAKDMFLLRAGTGAVAYVENDRGKTIETIRATVEMLEPTVKDNSR